ncbi:cancer-associated gene 1 protein isoform X8 [Mustela putorius furo]|uniref:Cancer-associated gene 1 protein isoform X8 n=1 Tax=Mustela putorius furo TaxID=9669 RepID=A0A8U0UQ25_MUSPF|nr:cancer-associated gene 1 protein isoform X8 [Mustela putorius furo]
MDPGKAFHHSTVRNKDYQKVWSSSSDPVHFETDVSHEKLESVSEAEAINISSLSQDLTHSHSPIYMETNSTTSDLPQNETKNAEREVESKFTLCEEMYGTLDDWLGDVSIGNDSQNLLTQPADISSFRQFEPFCKFHLREALNNGMIISQNPTESLPYTEKPERQSCVCNCAKDTNVKENLFKEENPVGTSTSTNEDQLAHECVRQPSRSPPLVHSSEETLKFREMSLPKSAHMESSQPQSFLYEENVHRDVEKPFYQENSFNLFDLRTNYTTEEISVSSRGIQTFGDIPEMPVCHHKEVAVEGMDRPRMGSPWSPASSTWGRGSSPDEGKMPDTKQSLESLQLPEEDMALNEVLQKLQHTNKQQQTRIQDLQSSNKYLEKKVKELQKQTTKQQVFVDIINELKAKVEELIEDKYRVMLEKNDTDKTLKNLHEVLAQTQKHLQEAGHEKETLKLELKKIKGNYIHLQERYMTEMQQEDETVSQCLKMDRTLREKEEEVEKLKQLKGELEKATTSTLDLLRREKKAQEQEFQSLQEEFQKHEEEHLEERQKLKATLKKLHTQVHHLQFVSENEKAKNAQLQQQVNELKQENARFRQQVVRSQEPNDAPGFDTAWLTEHSGEAIKADIKKDITTPDVEQKLKHFHLKKESLDKEIAKLGNLLESKEDRCSRLIEENDKYKRHLGNLINKVTSYEEIIECADQRLTIFHFQIAHLEKRNKHLEDLIRRPREKARKPRPRRLENHPKSLTTLLLHVGPSSFLIWRMTVIYWCFCLQLGALPSILHRADCDLSEANKMKPLPYVKLFDGSLLHSGSVCAP